MRRLWVTVAVNAVALMPDMPALLPELPAPAQESGSKWVAESGSAVTRERRLRQPAPQRNQRRSSTDSAALQSLDAYLDFYAGWHHRVNGALLAPAGAL